jgi:hypothetical protein
MFLDYDQHYDSLQKSLARWLDSRSRKTIFWSVLFFFLTPTLAFGYIGHTTVGYVGTVLGLVLGLFIPCYFTYRIMLHGLGFAGTIRTAKFEPKEEK